MSISGCCSPEELTKALKKKANDAGFEITGIARAEELSEEKALLGEWLRRGYNAGMAWMERNTDKRGNPEFILPGARSVITGAVNYWNETEPLSADSKFGKISRYAWAADYHEVIGEKLRILSDWLQSAVPGIQCKSYVDTGPVLEKAWAVRSGIGWLGKNTNIIIPGRGSWFFLGVLIIDVEMKYDEPVQDFCGSCTACIDACPTGALSPYVLNAEKCISYWTIEHRGDFSDELPALFENWIFGCDICQEVCPWNRFSRQTGVPELTVTKIPFKRRLEEWRKISEDEFKKLFRESPVARPKHRGFLRNVMNALKNSLGRHAYRIREKERKNRPDKR